MPAPRHRAALIAKWIAVVAVAATLAAALVVVAATLYLAGPTEGHR